MAKTALAIQIRDTHVREYRRTIRRMVLGSIGLWIVLALFLAGSHAGGAIVPVSIVMLIGLVVVRVMLWNRFRRDLEADLARHEVPAEAE